jgi:phage-related protein
MTGTDGIWEFRVQQAGMAYRLYAFWDGEGEEVTLIVCTHGLVKKTQKTPPKEIEKAERLKRLYFEAKSSKDECTSRSIFTSGYHRKGLRFRLSR